MLTLFLIVSLFERYQILYRNEKYKEGEEK